VFLAEALRRVSEEGYRIVNLDSTLILAQPKIGPHADVIRQRVSELLDLPTDRIGVKAKTPEGMGTENAAIAHVVVLLERAPRNIRRKSQKKSQL